MLESSSHDNNRIIIYYLVLFGLRTCRIIGTGFRECVLLDKTVLFPLTDNPPFLFSTFFTFYETLCLFIDLVFTSVTSTLAFRLTLIRTHSTRQLPSTSISTTGFYTVSFVLDLSLPGTLDRFL